MKRAVIFILLLLLVGGAGAWYLLNNSKSKPNYRFGKVERGDLFVSVNATGQVQPISQVQVGTQVTGTILKLHVDFNSRVKANQIIAEIDPALYQARVDQDKANLLRSESDVERVKAMLVQADKELKRSRELAKRELISPSEFDAAVATYDSLVAQVKVAEATVAQNRSALQMSEVNLRYTTIHSPIDGVVISRNVDVGQTVAASLQAPTIYVIANNLKHVQIQASVPEADIGRISEEQKVVFMVDAYRDNKFTGKVFQVRLSPTNMQNVVTYTVMIDAENPEEKLLPGMTANVTFEIAQLEGVLKVPNSALRFTPPSDTIPEANGKKTGERPAGKRGPRSRVWIVAENGPSAVSIVPGATDGSSTEIVKGELREGQEIITGIVQEGREPTMQNPFSSGGRGR